MKNTKSLLALFLACMMVMSCIVAVPVVAAESTVTGSTSFDGTYTAPATFSTWDGTSTDTEWAGSGSAEDPYIIATAAELAGLASQVNTASQTYSGVYFRLDENIDFANKEWTAIGYYGNKGNTSFRGVFDGNGKVIKNLTCTGTNSAGYAALFGYAQGSIKNLVIADATISGTSKEMAVVVALTSGNLTLEKVFIYNANVSGNYFRGLLIGRPGSGTFNITDCYVSGLLSGKSGWVGGFIGLINGGTPKINITNCTMAADVTGTSEVGGIIGGNNGYDVPLNIYNTKIIGNVTSTGNSVGGVAGSWKSSNAKTAITVDNIEVKGNVAGKAQVGGVVGYFHTNPSLLNISNSCVTGSITGTDGGVGGIVGRTNANGVVMNVENVLVDSAITGAAGVGGIFGHSLHATTALTLTNVVVLGSLSATGTSAPAVDSSRLGYTDIGAIAGAWGFSTAQAGPNITINSFYYNTTFNTAAVDVFDGTNNNGRLGTFYGAGADTIIKSGYTFYTPMTDCTSSVLGTAQTCPANTIAKSADEGILAFAAAWKAAVKDLDWYADHECTGDCTGTNGWVNKANVADGQYKVSCFDLCKNTVVEERDIAINTIGAGIRFTEPFGIRFAGRIYTEDITEGEYGILIIPTNMLDGELTIDTPQVLKIPAVKLLAEGNSGYKAGYTNFTGVVYNIPESAFDMELTAVVYYTVGDTTYYSDVMANSYYGVATQQMAVEGWADANPDAAATLQSVIDYVENK